MNKRPQKKQPRFLVIEGGRRKKDGDAKRRAELQAFIKACEALYEKNKATL